ncbi:unnamed protein product [Bursaphelenchus xylophilus]|uniref:(pine wood nematode) hypothetical protein n=1 Tax=Bursaphelenchus xylophilus TaxID=6326 RepID=A0A1I7RZ40_BURXY|nr:unnamed protein product [Bursaphelenchus xylophilus]CAG9106883.1 unnamed protein product [Bursaphelenchus xylophilus]
MVVTDDAPIAKTEETPEDDDWPLFNAKDHAEQFDPTKYLEGFYKTAKEDLAMQVVLFFLPGILYRLPNQVEDVLDLGAGPTVYIPIIMRHRAKNIYSSDYAEINRETVSAWLKNQSTFDWSNVCEWIQTIEASRETTEMMQNKAREIMKGVLAVNVHNSSPVTGVHYLKDPNQEVPKQFDAVCTVFCLEYASETLEEYEKAVLNASSLVKTGGYLVQGGVLEASEYAFGGRRFKCHFLTKEQLLGALQKSGFETDEKKGFKLIVSEEIFVLVAKKS